jgi:phage N-6-adenine-methyltransferase
VSHIAAMQRIDTPRSAKDDWFTPVGLAKALHREFCFTVDAAGHRASIATQIIGRAFVLPEVNGLEASWEGERVFLNPPYSLIQPWIEKAHRETTFGCELAVALLPANKTEQPWWQQYVEPFRDSRSRGRVSVETRFIAHRLKHGTPEDPHGDRADQGTFGSVLVIWRRG